MPRRKNIIDKQPLNWQLFAWIGLVAVIAGGIAISLPTVSTFLTGQILGILLGVAGAYKMVQSLKLKTWSGFVWQELTGAVELIGGIMIFFMPLKGAIAVSLLIGFVLLVHGLLQLALALKIREIEGWYWFVISGVVALLASIAIFLKLPYTSAYSPDKLAGIAIIIAGVAYLAIAVLMRKAKP